MIRVIGDRWSSHCHTIRDFLTRNQVVYEFVDTTGATTEAIVLARASKLPLVILPDGRRLACPSLTVLASYIGFHAQAEQPTYDLAIVGGGPGGLAAAVYGGSEGLCTLLIEKDAPGGQAGTSSHIENYLGFAAGVSGGDFAKNSVEQCRKFGVEILAPQEAVSLHTEGPHKHLTLTDGSEITCKVLLISTGVSWNLFNATGAERFIGSGIYYGASMVQAAHSAGEVVYMIGAGNSAGQAALHFKDHASKVVMLVRGNSLGAKMSDYLVQRIEAAPNIEVRLNTEVVECVGASRLQGLGLSTPEGLKYVGAEYLFTFLGASPKTEWLGDQVECDGHGFIMTGQDSARMFETSVPGVFACGDVRSGSVKRVASAVGEGSAAVMFVHQVLAELKEALV